MRPLTADSGPDGHRKASDSVRVEIGRHLALSRGVTWRHAVPLLLALALWGCESDAGLATAPLTSGAPTATAPVDELALEVLDPASRAALANAPVDRVLLFPAAFLSDAVVTSGPHFFAVSARHEDLTLSIHATDVVHGALPADVEIPPAELEVRGAPARESMNDGIRGVTWTEAGMTYDLEVECFEALTDARCTDDLFLRDLAEQLVEVSR